jgi:hypothetical protein
MKCNSCVSLANCKCSCSCNYFCKDHYLEHVETLGNHRLLKIGICLDNDSFLNLTEEINTRVHLIDSLKLDISMTSAKIILKIEELCNSSLERLSTISLDYLSLLKENNYSKRGFKKIRRIQSSMLLKNDASVDNIFQHALQFFSQNFINEVDRVELKRSIIEINGPPASYSDAKVSKVEKKQERFIYPEIEQDKINKIPLSEIDGPLPNYSNEKMSETEKKLGMFIYPDMPKDEVRVVRKNAVKMKNGAIYIGEWNAKNERHGKGQQMWPDGSKYEGYWKFDKANGRGRLIHDNGEVYECDWVDDRAHGFGVYLHTDGHRYEGSWANDKQHGEGKEEWPDGAVYEGEYFNGQKHGRGRFRWADGSNYEGEFSCNDIHGVGKYVWSDGRNYIGAWKINTMNGKGEFTWPDGRKYVGEYLNDKKEGFGVFEWPDGRKYEGEWKNGKQHGKGVYHSLHKTVEGVWVEGKRIKEEN